MTPDKKQNIKKAGHLIAGFVILLHAYHRFEEDHSNYILFLVFGLLFLSVAIFHHSLQKRFPWVDTVFFTIEGILSFVIAYENFALDKNGLGTMYIIAGLFQFFGLYMLRKRIRNN